MSEIQRSDPTARRQAVLFVVVGTVVGALLILAFERYYPALGDWVLSDPLNLSSRWKFVLLGSVAVLSLPLLVFAAYFWGLGVRVIRAQRFPLPTQRVIRDTPVLGGRAAVFRGRVLKALAVGLVIAAGLLSFVFWRLATLISDRAA